MLHWVSNKSSITSVLSKLHLALEHSDAAPESGGRSSSRKIFILKNIYIGILSTFKNKYSDFRLVTWQGWSVCWPRGRHETSKLGVSTGMGPPSVVPGGFRLKIESRVAAPTMQVQICILKIAITIHFVWHVSTKVRLSLVHHDFWFWIFSCDVGMPTYVYSIVTNYSIHGFKIHIIFLKQLPTILYTQLYYIILK